jgi:hypothetical protein
MLLFKRSQREKMGDPAFVDRTVERLRAYFLEDVYMLEPEELRFRVKHAIAKARQYGLTFESSITTFVLHMITINPAFDKQPAIQAALHDPEVEPNGRMTAMQATVQDSDWGDAAMVVDPEVYWAEVHAQQVKEG